jgi:hypothetical protein
MHKERPAAFIVFLFCSSLCLFAENGPEGPAASRSLDRIFPALDAETREKAFSPEGYYGFHDEKGQTLEAPGLDIQFQAKIGSLDPTVVVEYLLVLPYPSARLNSLDIYNGLRRIRALGGRLYHSETRGADVPLFENATRLESARKTSARDDPPPRSAMPDSETIYIRLRDANFGNSYYQADIQKNSSGFTYTLSNNRDLTYMIFPVIKSGCFVAQFYFEPLEEGILIYSISGVEVSDFIASRVSIASAIQKRLEVLLSWAVDGISGRL